ncbi:MAG TPA: glycosyltransferase [Chitinivibrionales bacterium]|nr:glycosyltransferase [Chitinivibrionales bacterium]
MEYQENIIGSKNALVSILIASYNHEKYIGDCLNSILKDRYTNKEIIIIDDGSTDNSVREINNWIRNNETRIKVDFTHRPNKGVTKTLNELVTRSSGIFICFVGSDDMLTEDSIQVRLDVLSANPNKMAVIGDAKVINPEGDIILNSAIEFWKGHKEDFMSDEKLRYMVVSKWSVPGPVLMVNRRIYDIIGLYPEDLTVEDLDFFLRAIGRDLVMFLDHIVAYYRILETSLCRNNIYSRDKIKSIIKSYWRNIHLFKLRYKIRILRNILLGLRDLLSICKNVQ